MLYNLNNDILFKIIKYEPIKCITISLKIYELIKTNKKLEKYIIKKYYNIFNLYDIFEKNKINDLFTKIRITSNFFYNNLSYFEKNLLNMTFYIDNKKYYWYDKLYIKNHKIINLFIMFFSVLEYDKLVDKLDIYVETNNIILIGNSNISHISIKHYILYKEQNENKYIFILKPDNILDYSLYLLNEILYNI